MKPKNLILLFIFGLFLFLLPNFAEAVCPLCCSIVDDSDCRWCAANSDISVERIGLIGSVEEQTIVMPVAEYCEDGQGKCQRSGFLAGYNGQSCTAIDQCSITGFDCNDCIQSGVWDASESQCVSCNGKKEEWVRGDTTEIYAGCSGVPSGCNNEGIQGTNYGKCESACGANTACDEVSDGGQCTVGLYCQALARNCREGDTCSGCICVSGNYELTVSKAGTGSGTVSSSPAGINCGTSCSSQSEFFNSGESVTLTATAASDSTFVIWSGDCSGTGSTCNLTMNANKSVTATFNLKLPNLQISDIENFGADRMVYYTIRNQGSVSTGAGFNCSLYVDGTYKDYQYFSSSLGAGLYRDGEFSDWTCTPGNTYSIEVCADDKNGINLITESDENDNCRTENLTCPAACTGTLNVSISGTETCTVTASLVASNCDGQSWQVKDNGITKCSGTVSSNSYSKTCSTWTVGVGTHTYYLYIGGVEKDSDSDNCPSAGCNCGGWTNQSCGYSGCSCPSYKRGQTRTCTPSGCDITCQCVCDESCCTVWANQGCGLGGCASDQMYQTRDCGDCPYSESQCVSDPSCGVVEINPPSVSTNTATVNKTSATLYGYLNSLGYDPATCTNCQCIVWFKWKLSTSSTWSETTPVSMTTEGPFTAILTGLTTGKTYNFEAFAKNGGSW